MLGEVGVVDFRAVVEQEALVVAVPVLLRRAGMAVREQLILAVVVVGVQGQVVQAVQVDPVWSSYAIQTLILPILALV
jgi:hypothetical protein